jgi:hypothetical protein
MMEKPWRDPSAMGAALIQSAHQAYGAGTPPLRAYSSVLRFARVFALRSPVVVPVLGAA